MAFTPHTLVTISGTLTEVSGQDEIWSIGIRGFDPQAGAHVPVPENKLQQFADDIVTASGHNIVDWFTDPNTVISSSVHLRQVKTANIGADGKYLGAPGIHQTDHQGAASTAGVSFLSIAYSWTTDTTFGRRLRYGRVYPPNFCIQEPYAAANISAASQNQAVGAAKALLTAVALTDTDYQFDPYVVSREGGFAKITGVRVGNVWDVQRRRKNAVRETYVADNWP